MAIDINTKTTGLTLTPDMRDEVIGKTLSQSFVMQLAQRVELPGRGLSVPVITGEPVADFVGETDEKPVSNATFKTKTMTPYKIAVIELFSAEFRRDYAALYDELVRRLPDALAKKFDSTIIGGTAPGTGFDVLTEAAAQDIETDAYAGVVAAYGTIAKANYAPNGFALSPSAEVLLYAAHDDGGQPLFIPSLADGSIGSILGVPVLKSGNAYAAGNPATIGLLGDWSQARYGIVGDISLDFTEDATVNTGSEQVNLWQRNMIGVRAEVSVGFVAANSDAFVRLTEAASA